MALARYLIGRILVHDSEEGRTSGRIVETEAYVVGDSSGHAFRGDPRNRSLFLERGHAYVYFIYGCWFSLNVSSEQAGTGAGVLLRAVEPLEGLALMAERRGTRRPRDLAEAPAGSPPPSASTGGSTASTCAPAIRCGLATPLGRGKRSPPASASASPRK